MKIRLDQLVVERGLAPSRERAQRLIRAGMVLVDEHCHDKPGRQIDPQASIRLKGEICPYVSRGGLKLAAALERFGMIDLNGRLALDIGASTGGFTDCLLQRGAAHVWAVDTGRGQIHTRLRADPRVTLRERANARFLKFEWVDDRPIDLIAIDVSFISLRLILPPVENILTPGGSVLALVKPQFEAGPQEVGRGGVVRRRPVHRQVLEQVIDFCRQRDWQIHGLIPSPLIGPAGNLEFFLRLARAAHPPGLSSSQTDIAIEQALDEAYNLIGVSSPGEFAPGGPDRPGEETSNA